MTEAATATAAVVEFELGDRVVLHGLEGAAHLNKCHGVVAAKKQTTSNQQDSHLYAVHLDILKTLWIKPGNLSRENEMSKYTLQNRAPVVDGVLEPNASAKLGLPLMRTFAIIRWIVATQFLQSKAEADKLAPPMTLQQILRLPLARSQELNAYAIQNWHKPSTKTGVCACLCSFVQHQQDPQLVVEKRFMARALQSRRAMQSWHLGLHGDFWLVARDDQGTLVVPDKNKDLVYKIVGISRNSGTAAAGGGGGAKSNAAFKQPGEALSLNKVPVLLPALTIVPWYGRLLYDTTLLSPVSSHQRATDSKLAVQLQERVLKAVQNSTVIDYLADLEEKPQ